jgi:hypothetical protein
MRRPGTTFIQFRKRIPQDVLSKARGASLAIPVGDEVSHTVVGARAGEIAVSLRTRDQREAKERQARVIVYLDGVWQSLREGPKQLSHKQIQALAGEVHKQLVASFEDDPGSPEAWREVVQLQAKAMAGDDAARERWFGPTVDQTLASHGLVVSADTVPLHQGGIDILSACYGRNFERENDLVNDQFGTVGLKGLFKLT